MARYLFPGPCYAFFSNLPVSRGGISTGPSPHCKKTWNWIGKLSMTAIFQYIEIAFQQKDLASMLTHSIEYACEVLAAQRICSRPQISHFRRYSVFVHFRYILPAFGEKVLTQIQGGECMDR
jgi:hypothetical protein